MSSYIVRRTDAEIDDLEGKCIEAEADGTSKYPGETYEQGIQATLRWLFEDGENPLED